MHQKQTERKPRVQNTTQYYSRGLVAPSQLSVGGSAMKRILRFKSLLLAVLLSILLPVHAQNRSSLTARDYFNELVASGGLDHMAKGHACFQDDPKADSFFILWESKYLRDFMLSADAFSKLPKITQELMKKDFLMVRGYPKGIPWRGEEFLEKDDESWVSDQHMLDERTPVRIRFNVDWQTWRYKYSVEVLNMDSTYRSEVASFGRCEELPAEVQQRRKD